MELLRHLWPMLKPQRWRIAGAFLCVAVYALSQAAYGVLAGPATQYIFEQDALGALVGSDGEVQRFLQWVPSSWISRLQSLDAQQIHWVIPGALVLFTLLKGLAQTGQFRLFGIVAQHGLRTIREDSFAALLRRNPLEIQSMSRGDIVNRIGSDAKYIEAAIFYGFASMVRDSLSLGVIVALLVWADPAMALSLLILGPIAGWSLARFTSWLKRVARRSQAAEGELVSVLVESAAGLPTIQSLGAEARQEDLLHMSNQRLFQQMIRSYTIRALRTPVMELIGTIAFASMLVFVATKGTQNPAHYVSFLALLVLMYDPLKKLGKVGDHLAAGQAAWGRLQALRTPPSTEPTSAQEDLPTPDEALGIDFDGVEVRYPGSPPALHALSFSVGPGELVAFVGESGAGKSTIAKTLLGFLSPSKGEVRLGGRPLNALSLEAQRRMISIVEQEPFLFRATVAENIAMGAKDPSPETLREAAALAQASGFIEGLPQGMQTPVDEGGASLSGGQRQRIALARALARKSPILILDEATNQLDAENEDAFNRSVLSLKGTRTILVIAHRLKSLRAADRIVVLQDGRAAESGTFDQLIAQDGIFARMVRLQEAPASSNEGTTTP